MQDIYLITEAQANTIALDLTRKLKGKDKSSNSNSYSIDMYLVLEIADGKGLESHPLHALVLKELKKFPKCTPAPVEPEDPVSTEESVVVVENDPELLETKAP